MKFKRVAFKNSHTDIYFDTSLVLLDSIVNKEKTVVITDENIYSCLSQKLQGYKVIRIQPGEEHKTQATIDKIINELLDMDVDKSYYLVGLGGGVVTDITGFVASVYKRGIGFGYVPTTLLGMVDAAVGGKNGIDVGIYKNVLGTISQPAFLLYDYNLLKTLPEQEWINGFAEIIKHAVILDAKLFETLENHVVDDYRKNHVLLGQLIQKNVEIKLSIVTEDENEMGRRKLLNFGHTFGHAIENIYKLPHGFAVAIGMVIAAYISEKQTGFKKSSRLVRLIRDYKLPAYMEVDFEKAIENMRADKKRINNKIHFILLEKIGKSVVKEMDIETLDRNVYEFIISKVKV